MTGKPSINKRVLFVNPAKENGYYADRVHMGFSLLGQILSESGCQVKVVDYSFLKSIESGTITIPDIEDIIQDFKPDVIGISIFSYLYDESQKMIDQIFRCCNTPIIVGGPHVTLFPEDFSNDARVSYIVKGEAEAIITTLVNSATREPSPVLINSPVPTPEQIPAINLDIVHESRHLRNYQIQLSRGCPFNCSFCTIDSIAGRKMRARDLDYCLDQVVEAKGRYPNIQCIAITDDCPTFNGERFKEFLKKLVERRVDAFLTVDNMRADLIDEEMLQLYIKAGGQNICLGVESADPEVFKMVHKSESLDKIINAARLVHKYNLQLGLCFVIGLPGDTLEKHRESVKLAKKLKADYIFWNVCVPWPGTEVYEWFKRNGKIGEIRNFSPLIDSKINFKDPPAESNIFKKEDIVKAWLAANMETCNLSIIALRNPRNIPAFMLRLLYLTRRYKLYKSALIFVWKLFTSKMWFEIKKRLKVYRWKRRREKFAKNILLKST